MPDGPQRTRAVAFTTVFLATPLAGRAADVSHAVQPWSSPPATVTIDGTGAYLIPGLWDIHAHLRASGLPEQISTEWLMPLLLAHGVTGVPILVGTDGGDSFAFPNSSVHDELAELVAAGLSPAEALRAAGTYIGGWPMILAARAHRRPHTPAGILIRRQVRTRRCSNACGTPPRSRYPR